MSTSSYRAQLETAAEKKAFEKGVQSERMRGDRIRERASKCISCADLNNDDYAVHDDLWRSAYGSSQAGFAHIRCLEKKLGRKLTVSDFKNALVNAALLWAFERASEESP